MNLHHFRSTNLKEEYIYLHHCWKKCLEQKNILIPAFTIKIPEKDGFRKETLKTLLHFKDIVPEEDMNQSTHFNKTQDHADLPSIDISTINNTDQVSTIYNTNQSLDNNTIHNVDVTDNNVSNLSVGTPTLNIITFPNFASNDSSFSTPSFNVPLSNPTEKINKSNQLQLASTPIKPDKKKSKEVLIVSLKPVTTPSTQITTELSRSAQLLEKVFGKTTQIAEFDQLRKKVKRDRNYLKQYQILLAEIEVKLNIKEEELDKQLKSMEMADLNQESETIENTEEYINVVNKLKYIKVLHKSLKL